MWVAMDWEFQEQQYINIWSIHVVADTELEMEQLEQLSELSHMHHREL